MMKRRALIKNGILAAAAAAFAGLPKMPRAYHFVGIGTWGGRILESMHRNGAEGKYTWITDQHSDVCEVPNLERVTVEHPYSAKYFSRHRIKKLPEKIPFPDELTDCLPPDAVTVLLAEPSCYLSYAVLPELVDRLENRNQSYHGIMALPFPFIGELEVETAEDVIFHLQKHPGRITTFSANTVRWKEKNPRLDKALEFLHERFFLEFEGWSESF